MPLGPTTSVPLGLYRLFGKSRLLSIIRRRHPLPAKQANLRHVDTWGSRQQKKVAVLERGLAPFESAGTVGLPRNFPVSQLTRPPLLRPLHREPSLALQDIAAKEKE
jgi:hypothetical protein